MIKISVLGSTGTIGRGVLDIIRAYPHDFRIVGLSTNTNIEMLEKQVEEFKPISAGIGEKDLIQIASLEQADLVVVAVVGLSGLLPTLAAIKKGKNVAIATKEVLVVAGELVMKEAKKHKVNIIPIDSEHSAIFQCLHAGNPKEINKLILTMGKGPIARMKKHNLSSVTIKQIFNRPAWKMGNKITVDSATCLNKSFEVIEAKWLFGVEPNQIEVLVHPEYICHSMVEFIDGSIVAEMGSADMRRYIQYALFYPERKEMRITKGIDMTSKTLSFEKAPYDKFPGLELGFEAIKIGKTLPAVLHGADESAVQAFLSNQITFTDIPKIIKKTMSVHKLVHNPGLQDIISAEHWGQEYAKKLISKKI